jgi:hypothetical protein
MRWEKAIEYGWEKKGVRTNTLFLLTLFTATLLFRVSVPDFFPAFFPRLLFVSQSTLFFLIFSVSLCKILLYVSSFSN